MAWPFLQRIGGDCAPLMLEMLGHLYQDQGKLLDSIATFKKRMQLSPRDRNSIHRELDQRDDVGSGARLECRRDVARLLRALARQDAELDMIRVQLRE